MKKVFAVLLSLFIGTYIPSFGQNTDSAVINEFLSANNQSGLDPDFNQFADWIELHNPGNSALDISGYFLTDDLSDLQKWVIPSGTEIPADGYLLIWADGEDIFENGLHTNFKLNKGGEEIVLSNPDGVTLDSYIYNDQIVDVSLGRSSSEPEKWLYFSNPTPGFANSATGFQLNQQSEKPFVSLRSGFYQSGQTITMSSLDDALIYYSIDGSIPNEHSLIYQSPLVLTATTVLNARVIEPDRLASPIVTRSYFIDEQTTLPVVSLTVDPANLWSDSQGIYNNQDISSRREWKRPAYIDYFDEYGRFGFSDDIDIRLFGRSAIYLPEKSLSVFLSGALNYPLFGPDGVQRFYSFILRSSSDDWHLTMFRDAYIHTVVKQNLTNDTQAYCPAILFINGEYWGIHNIREKYNEDYLAVHHGADPDNIDLLYLDFRDPANNEALAGDWDNYNMLVDFIDNHDLSLQSNYDVVAAMMDIDNFIDYVIAESLCGNTSWRHNIRVWRPRKAGGKWQWLMFDTDRGFRTEDYNTLQQMSETLPPFRALLANQGFRERFLDRFSECLSTGFQPAQTTAILDSIQTLIAAEIPRHSERWKDECGNGVCGIPSINDWQANVATMRSIAEARPTLVRQQLIDLFGAEQLVQLNLDVSVPGYGHIDLGEQTVISGNYAGLLFKNEAVTLQADPNAGYLFAGWREFAATTEIFLRRGSEWKYFDEGILPGFDWYSPVFDDHSWAGGSAQLGYGDNDEATTVEFGPNSNNKYITTYFRSSFPIADVSTIQNLSFNILRDDGAVVYLNGQEIFRSNMPAGMIDYETLAENAVSGDDEDTFFEYVTNPGLLVNGTNCLAVEIHQISGSSSDISFDMEVSAESAVPQNDDYVSHDPQLSLVVDHDLSLEAVFTPNPDNVLPEEMTTSTVLSAANSPYFALADVTVEPNVTLTIEPGVEIHMADGVDIDINGELQAAGTADLPIIFRGVGKNSWGAICIEDATGQVLITHARIDGATTGRDASQFKAAVSSYNSDITLDHVKMGNIQQPFYALGGMITVRNSSLDGTGAGDDMINIQHASAVVENCYLFGNGELDFDYVDNGVIRNTRIDIISTNSNRDGIDIGSSQNVLIENNRIFDCPDKGISIGEKSTAIIRGNLVVNADMAIAVKDSSTADIERNTFFNDSVGIACYEKNAGQGGGAATVRNTIFAGMQDAEFSTDNKSNVQIAYSLSDQNLLDGTGNILGDPLFISAVTGDFHLQSDSPCIDAGDPDSAPDSDNTRADIGAFYYNQNLAEYSMLYINEFMTFNTRTILDNAGEYEDWIEIYNKGNQAVDLGGLYMTDDFSNPTSYQLSSNEPEQTTIAAGGYLLFWADDEVAQGTNHLGFGLNHEGEQLALVLQLADSVVFIDSVSFGPLADDRSFGRSEDGGDEWVVFPNPTPGSRNDGSGSAINNLPAIPHEFAISQNYPNPFNPTTKIAYQIPEASFVKLHIYDITGRLVTILVNEEKIAGYYTVIWNAGQVSSGLYIYVFEAEGFRSVKKCLIVK